MLLLRHASAGERLSSPTIDRFRQLDQAGRVDARQLVVDAGGSGNRTGAGRARSLGASRPWIPIAESRRLVIERRDELLPDARLEATLELLEELSDASLLCTHREVIRQLFEGEVACEKGGTWVLERIGSLWSPTAYLPSPTSVTDAFPRAALSR